MARGGAFVTPLLDPALVAALGRLVPGARRTALGLAGGLHRSPFKGAGVEFRQHRQYVAGDDPRHLDWRVLARTDRPFVREYDAETTRRTLIVVDASGSMAYGHSISKSADAAKLAAALAYVSLGGGESAGLLLARDSETEWLAPSATATQLARIVDALGQMKPAGPTALDGAFARAADHGGRRALVIVISDLMLPPERLRRGLARLRHGRHDVAVVRVLHADETDFPFRGWVRFGDLEAGGDTFVSAAAARKNYLVRFASHDRQLREACRASRAGLIDHIVGRPVLDTVRAVVRRGRS